MQKDPKMLKAMIDDFVHNVAALDEQAIVAMDLHTLRSTLRDWRKTAREIASDQSRKHDAEYAMRNVL